MTSLLKEAAEKLKKIVEKDYEEGNNHALESIIDERIDLSEVERYADYDNRNYVDLRKEQEFITQSDAFLDGYINGCWKAIREMQNIE